MSAILLYVFLYVCTLSFLDRKFSYFHFLTVCTAALDMNVEVSPQEPFFQFFGMCTYGINAVYGGLIFNFLGTAILFSIAVVSFHTQQTVHKVLILKHT